jgi:hypothetical protein
MPPRHQTPAHSKSLPTPGPGKIPQKKSTPPLSREAPCLRRRQPGMSPRHQTPAHSKILPTPRPGKSPPRSSTPPPSWMLRLLPHQPRRHAVSLEFKIIPSGTTRKMRRCGMDGDRMMRSGGLPSQPLVSLVAIPLPPCSLLAYLQSFLRDCCKHNVPHFPFLQLQFCGGDVRI